MELAYRHAKTAAMPFALTSVTYVIRKHGAKRGLRQERQAVHENPTLHSPAIGQKKRIGAFSIAAARQRAKAEIRVTPWREKGQPQELERSAPRDKRDRLPRVIVFRFRGGFATQPITRNRQPAVSRCQPGHLATRALFAASEITGAHIRAARALLGWTTEDRAESARMGLSTIGRAEAENGACPH